MADEEESDGRDVNGRFAKGNAGGPGGPRRRSFELRRAAEEAIAPDHLAAMIRKATRMGLEGNLAAMRFVFERTCGRSAQAPAPMEPIDISIPHLRSAVDCNNAIQRLIDGICKGDVDRDAAKILIDAIQTRVRSIEVNELEDRLAQLEQAAHQARGARQ